ncbi:Ctf8p NDAI_0D03280 [Naumovozyma dairenensis CBS 421]|uniref:Chromosome transmission fidelity protein 8 n=1 Tax=Naumovozyma dairenensis (strain ATCC 10597 / BCRC 20456 / CBS 421 / NBRC 0211 / NRRL Y-12639) TaxID=1071378 RepID=G0WA31_NAUDC|nr:hypothetical protein NDAI_0D03280 [Naumovozyma dairenensis CBS 421]CCD24642.1 hypothetical protein NDAI_0D03280 [Naumovozyma dairenensis CBS 421]
MPAVEITTSHLQTLLHETQDGARQITIPTPLGHTMLEIQGDLEMPKTVPTDAPDSRYSKYNDGEIDIVRFGLLNLDQEKKLATLFIGTKQRLLGKIVKLDTPLGLLKFDNSSKKVQLVDVINYKIIFSDRPLPIH